MDHNHTRKLADKVPESKITTTDELKDAELDKVSGGVADLGKYITKAVDDAISAAIGGHSG
jgi:hypothetical protein